MKKQLSSALALCFVLALAGCGGKGQTQDIKSSQLVKLPSVSIEPTQSAPVRTEPRQNRPLEYETTVLWVNYSDDASKLYTLALNSNKMTDSSVLHLPIFKCSSLEDLEQFKSDFSGVLDFSAQYDEIASFDEAGNKYDAAFF